MKRNVKRYLWIACGVFVIALVIFNIVVIVGTAGGDDLEVRTKNGYVTGTKERTQYKDRPYYAYRGIPYAKAPIGDLRFQSPVPNGKWCGTLNASKYQSSCVQFYGVGSEDCLYLNVFVPAPWKRRVPVMVWVHGGAFAYGGSSEFPPENFIEENVIFISFDYRLGIFGFFSTGDTLAPGNAGIKDQILALKWIQQNIQYFGGDPNKITVFGESAGAASIAYMLQTPKTKGLFSAAIMQSGSSLNAWALCRNKRATVERAAALLNINATDSQHLLDGFRKVNASTLALLATLVSTEIMMFDTPMNGWQFSPSIEPESAEAVITQSSYDKLQKGEFHNVPLILGLNSEEGLVFNSVTSILKLYLTSFFKNPSRLVPTSLHLDDDSMEKVGTIIMDRYFPDQTNETVLKQDLIAYISDTQFERPIHKALQFYSKQNTVFFYRYSSYNKTNEQILPGVAHFQELYDEFYLPRTNVSLKLVRLWANFAKNFKPTVGHDSVLDKVVWNPYKENDESYLDIDETLTVHYSFNEISENFQFWDNLYINATNIDTY